MGLFSKFKGPKVEVTEKPLPSSGYAGPASAEADAPAPLVDQPITHILHPHSAQPVHQNIIENPLHTDHQHHHHAHGESSSSGSAAGTQVEPRHGALRTPVSSSTPSLSDAEQKPAKEPNSFVKFARYVDSRICAKSVWEIISPVDYFWPITIRRYACLLLIGALCVGIYYSNVYTGWIHKSMTLTRSFMLPVLVIVLCLEPVMFICILAGSRLPPLVENLDAGNNIGPLHKNKLDDEEVASFSTECSEEQQYNTALVLPCHKSDTNALRRVFESACRTAFRPKDIFVVDNARQMHPTDLKFRDWVKAQHPEINYMWSPIGSKNAAQLVGALAAKGYKYILTTDDDVCLPTNYRHPFHLLTETTRAVAFPLTATDDKGDNPLFIVSWQDCEYRTAGLTKLAESNTCGVCFPHGAGWFIDRDVLIEIMEKYHPTDFIAEDVNAGFCMMKMGKSIALDFNTVLATEVPLTLIGPGLNWFKQRVLSWEMGRHTMFFTLLRRIFLNNGQTTLTGALAQKVFLTYNVLTLIVDWIRVPVFVTMGYSGLFWWKVALLGLISIVPLLLYNYVKCFRRPHYRVRLAAALTYPIYKQLYTLVSIMGFCRAVLFYMGGYIRAKPVHKMLKDGDKECFWLDPRFETNPAYLADDREDELIAEGVMPPRDQANFRSFYESRETVVIKKKPEGNAPTVEVTVRELVRPAKQLWPSTEPARPLPALTRARSF